MKKIISTLATLTTIATLTTACATLTPSQIAQRDVARELRQVEYAKAHEERVKHRRALELIEANNPKVYVPRTRSTLIVQQPSVIVRPLYEHPTDRFHRLLNRGEIVHVPPNAIIIHRRR